MEIRCKFNKPARRAFSIVELLVVVLIIGILASIAVGVFLKQSERARYAAAKFEIRELETAIARYEIDVGQYPPTGSGTGAAPTTLLINPPFNGNGFLYMALQMSLNRTPTNPLDPLWQGPYMKFADTKVGVFPTGSFTQPMFVDPWGNPYWYCRSGYSLGTRLPADYIAYGGTEYFAGNPLGVFESFFNPTTFQIFSLGPNESTFAHPAAGLDLDDVGNLEGR